jgi:hypothetical protein
MATRDSIRQSINQLEGWIRSGAAARDVEGVVREVVRQASRYIPPEALRRLITVIERAKPYAERAAAAARANVRRADAGATRKRSAAKKPTGSRATASAGAKAAAGTGAKSGAKSGTKAATKAATKKPAAGSPARKTSAKKAPAKKAQAKKAPAKKAAAKKPAAKKAAPTRAARAR